MIASCPFPANYGSPGGIREMAETLVTLGHEIHVVTYPFGENLTVKGVKIWRCWTWTKKVRIYSGPSLEKLLLDFFLLIELCRIVSRENLQVIHAHNYEGALIGFIAKILTGRPLLYNATNLMSDELPLYEFLRPAFLAKWLAQFLDFLIPRIPDGFIAITRELEAALLRRGVPSDRVVFVPYGINLEMFRSADPEPLRERYRIGERPLVMYAGINSPIQRLDYLLRAFRLVRTEIPDALLMMLSPLTNDQHLAKNRNFADELGLESSVIWVQGHELTHLPHYLALASVTAISRPDMPGQPIKLMNYMAAAKPIVCFTGAAKGVRHLHDAFVAQDHDWEDLAQGILTLLKDRELAQRLASNARQTVEREFDWRVLCLPVANMYRSLAENLPIKSEPEMTTESSISGSMEQP
jgi:glycosyltransferase involved in cell wall biosynthesis